jgi:SAM-dependent methyltransferase
MKERQNQGARPIFIHAMWRTGSTYVWKKFRDQQQYRAYFEPFNEYLVHSPAELSEIYSQEKIKGARHAEDIGSYFNEYPFTAGGGVEYFAKSFAYQKYCLEEGEEAADVERYVANLIDHAHRNGQIPVLQFNRSFMRAGWLNARFRPINIVLVRRPFATWRSFLSFGTGFLTLVYLVTAQNREKEPMKYVADWHQAPPLTAATHEEEALFYWRYASKPDSTLYSTFYEFDLAGILSCSRYADCILDMDELTVNPKARDAAEARLRELGIKLSLQDCSLPSYTAESAEEKEWLAYEGVARKLLRKRLPSRFMLTPGKLKEHEPMLGDYFREIYSEFALHPGGESRMPDTLIAVSNSEKHHQGTLLFEQGCYGEAAALLDEALGEQETAERWNDWAAVQLALGHRENAERGFRRALTFDPKLTDAAANLGILLFYAGKLKHAEPFLKPALEAANGQQRERLLEMLAQCEAVKVVPPVSESERAVLYAHHRFDAALSQLRSMASGLTAQFPASREARFLLAEVLQAGGQADLALVEYQKLLEGAPVNEKRRIEQAIDQCQADRDYFPIDFANRVVSGEYVTGINAGGWRSYARREIQRGREIVRLIQKRIPIAGRRMLDVGCGYGGALIAFAEQGAEVVGVEISEERARVGRKRLADLGIEVDYRLDDICEPGIQRRLGTFDIIVVQDVLEHVLDPGQTIRMLSSLLRPGGVIYAQVGNKYSPDQLLSDHHYGRAGITLLARDQAIDYFRVATGIGVEHYGVGYWRTEAYYRRMFARFGVQLDHSENFAHPDQLVSYTAAVSAVCRRAEQEIQPGLRPELQQRIRRRMAAVASYFARMCGEIVKNASNPQLMAEMSDQVVKRICIPVWRFVGTKPVLQA